ncbi:MAG: putative manganese-dependent inorganic diphosphatase [Spirochaetaceae bacterium]|nr:putative manganese-dependent inorganic diphosphatase [Spirochaetaceae bacterium]
MGIYKEKRTYVIGHVNPDADSIVSAYAYAYLKQALGNPNCKAVRAGSANAQTEFIFEKFGVPLPRLLPDLIPKVKHYAEAADTTIGSNASLWEALQLMTANSLDLLPVINAKGHYQALLYYESFAHYILNKANPQRQATVHSSINLMCQTIKGQELTKYNAASFEEFAILVGADYTATLKEAICSLNPANLVVLIGDRFDLQRFIIEKKVRLLIITGGFLLSPELCRLAQQNEVSVLVSPYDSTTTSMMLMYSAPVLDAADVIESVGVDLPLKKAKTKILAAKPRALPVVDDDSQTLCGIISESDLMKEPKVNVILVDHNELAQSIEGIENYKILEVIDHHKLGLFKTDEPITFVTRVVGSTSSLIAEQFRAQKAPIPKELAGLLLGGIISDTIGLKSVTTTDFDHKIAHELATIAHINFEQLAAEIAKASDNISGKNPHDLIVMDQKIYERGGKKYLISQIETTNVGGFTKERATFLTELRRQLTEQNAYFACLMLTDLSKLSSYLFIEGDSDFIAKLPYPKHEENLYFMKGVLSRKKQLIPLFSEIFNAVDN